MCKQDFERFHQAGSITDRVIETEKCSEVLLHANQVIHHTCKLQDLFFIFRVRFNARNIRVAIYNVQREEHPCSTASISVLLEIVHADVSLIGSPEDYV